MTSSDPTPLDIILTIADAAHVTSARHLVQELRSDLLDGDDPMPWCHAVLVARDAGALAPAPACYLLDIITEGAMTSITATDATLVALADQMEAIERADGLTEDECYALEEAPAEWSAVNRRWESRFVQLQAALLERAGAPEVARLCRLRPEEYQARSQAGWRALLRMPEEE